MEPKSPKLNEDNFKKDPKRLKDDELFPNYNIEIPNSTVSNSHLNDECIDLKGQIASKETELKELLQKKQRKCFKI